MAADPQERSSPRREQRRADIARACFERLAEEGFAEARLEALAADAGLSKQNLLFYFRDKADLFAEALTCASEETYRILARRILGEQGPTAIRALRRGLDEIRAVLPAAFALVLEGGGSVPRASAQQQARATAAQEAFLGAFATALAAGGRNREGARRFARMAWLGLVAHHREAWAAGRSGLSAASHLAADLDYAEGQLVALAGTLRARG